MLLRSQLVAGGKVTARPALGIARIEAPGFAVEREVMSEKQTFRSEDNDLRDGKWQISNSKMWNL
jgi:hypothetical protein